MQTHLRWNALLVIVLSVGFMQSGISASFNVNPIGFDLSAEQSSGVLQVKNTGDEPVRIQVSAVDWSTDGREEVLTDTDALILNPPIFAVGPEQTQFLRFGVRHPVNSAIEKTYRLLIEEVPPSGPQAPGIKTLLRVSIPVFIAPQKKQEKISWQLKQKAKNLLLTAVNDGNVHTKIARIQLRDDDSNEDLQIRAPAYVLPGQHKEWSLATGKIRAGKVRLHIQTDKGEIEEYLTLEADQVSSR